MNSEWNDEPKVVPEWQEVREQMRPWVKPEVVVKRRARWLTYVLGLCSLAVGYIAAAAIWQGYWPAWSMIPAAGVVALMCWLSERQS